jgi:hypothetical protein
MNDLQYLRKASLIVAENVGQGLDLSQLRFTFLTRAMDVQTPNALYVRVFNLSEATVRAIINPPTGGPQYRRVIAQAGYEQGNYGIIFDGSIKQVRTGRVDAIDTFLDIFAADGDIIYNNATINQSLAAGSTPEQRLQAMVGAFDRAQPGTTVAYAPEVPLGPVLPRGKVLFGLAREYMRDFAVTANAAWSIQNGQVVVIPQTSYRPGDAVVLSSVSGMIGMPEQTDNGIRVLSLLNPKLLPGVLVKIDNKSIIPGAINLQYTAINNFASISNDGIYKIIVSEHKGDTRGNPWYTELTCLAADPSAQIGVAVKPFAG